MSIDDVLGLCAERLGHLIGEWRAKAKAKANESSLCEEVMRRCIGPVIVRRAPNVVSVCSRVELPCRAGEEVGRAAVQAL